jgi:hypothetical protein
MVKTLKRSECPTQKKGEGGGCVQLLQYNYILDKTQYSSIINTCIEN